MTLSAEKSGRGRSIGGYLIRMRSLNVFFIFVILFAVFTFLSPGNRFISKDNILIYLATGAEFNIIAVAVGMLMISGEFDLSVGSVLVFCSYTFTQVYASGVHILLAVIITAGAGTILGFINGMITVKARIPSFITTLGAMLLWRGVTLMWSGGEQKGIDLLQHPVMYKLIAGSIGGLIPSQFFWFIGIAVILALIMHYHKVGNWIFTTGDNREAARAMGIRTDRMKVLCFSIVGFAVAVAAVMQIFRAGTFSARAGDGWELKAIAAAVVGGTALTGGIGSMMGVFWGAFVISVIENGLVLLRVPYYWTFTIFGVVIVSTAILSVYIEKRRLLFGAERC